uniref:RRM domain-containing protein n=1 Tax=Glossina brevipalpis TaxID=37001 RepID=A0A1A9X175_9MUSC
MFALINNLFTKMALSGKKGRKNKGTVISLKAFLGDTDTPAGTVQITKKIQNHSSGDSDSDSSGLLQVYQLPTAPRAKRILNDSSIPYDPPYVAYLTNLPFDVNESDIYEHFKACNVLNVRLPRENGDTGRFKGFGYIDLKARDDLIQVLSLPDPNIKGRRIKIELPNGNDQQNARKQVVNWRASDNESRESTNWRSGIKLAEAAKSNLDCNVPGSWRVGNRSSVSSFSTRKSSPDDGRGSFQERPKLNLKPRTVPAPEIVIKSEPAIKLKPSEFEKQESIMRTKSSGTSASKIFGSAKPINTLAKDLEIEKRLEEKRKEIKMEKSDKKFTKSNKSWHRQDEQHSDTNNKDCLERRKEHKNCLAITNKSDDEDDTDRFLPKGTSNQSDPETVP